MKSFEKITMWRVRCYKCGGFFSLYDEDFSYQVFETKEEAKDVIDADDFWKREGDKAYCEECYLAYKLNKD